MYVQIAARFSRTFPPRQGERYASPMHPLVFLRVSLDFKYKVLRKLLYAAQFEKNSKAAQKQTHP